MSALRTEPALLIDDGAEGSLYNAIQSEVVIVSFVPEGVAVGEWVTHTANGIAAFAILILR